MTEGKKGGRTANRKMKVDGWKGRREGNTDKWIRRGRERERGLERNGDTGGRKEKGKTTTGRMEVDEWREVKKKTNTCTDVENGGKVRRNKGKEGGKEVNKEMSILTDPN